jgi:glycosyltransferase involved in cell wall biosynthesis
VAIGEKHEHNHSFQNIQHIWYEAPQGAGEKTHHYLRGLEAHVRRGQTVLRLLVQLKKKDFQPDIICVHPGWGEGLYVKEAYPNVPILGYFEFYYHPQGIDVGFDPEFPSTLDDQARVRTKNTTNLLSLDICDYGLCPTNWQKSVFPKEFQHKLWVIHDGIDTEGIRPKPEVQIHIARKNIQLDKKDEVITFVNRNLEPYRGFHTFMRAVPKILRLRHRAKILIIGGEEVSYGRRLPQGQTYKQKYLQEIGITSDRVYFLGRLPYNQYLGILQISSVHVYLTYPFVLSWSMLEAMSCGCVVIGSNTPPVLEIIEDNYNGLLVDFFNPEQIVQKINDVLENPKKMQTIKDNARNTIVKNYDLKTKCLPEQVRLIKRICNLEISSNPH